MTKLRPAYIFSFGLLLTLFAGFVYYPVSNELVAVKVNPPDSLVMPEPPHPVPVNYVAAIDAPNPFLHQAILNYKSFIEKGIRNKLAPGAAVAIVHDSSIILLQGFGVKVAGTQDSVDINSVFRLGSVSKSMAAILAGTLVNSKLIAWDDPVVTYYPNFQLQSEEHARQLTIRQVLSHTTGLPYHAFTNMVEEHLSLDTLLTNLKTVKLVAPPGQVYSYQNVGYSLIEKVVSAATQQDFETALKDRVFQPLGMHNSSASYQAIVNNPNVAKPHHFNRKEWVPVPISDTYYNVQAAGGVNASIADMALWLKALMQGNLLMTDSVLAQIFEPQVKAISKNRNFYRWQRPRASYYALGWRVIQFPNQTLLYHGGYVNGYRSEVAIDQKNKIAICVLTNSAGQLADVAVPEFFKMISAKADSIKWWENQTNPRWVKHTSPAYPVSK
ncbi:MAG: beta-lactamase family protein [Cytophagales bacterium]|nr:beta-lactamase family protein [Cytophagales bacterium]